MQKLFALTCSLLAVSGFAQLPSKPGSNGNLIADPATVQFNSSAAHELAEQKSLAAMGHPIALTETHRRSVNRRRRIVVQFDAADHRHVHATPKEWLAYIFNLVDEPDSQIDSICWDIGMGDWAVYPSKVLAPFQDDQLGRWREQGFEWVGALVEECRKRNVEVFWNHRISEVDIAPDGGLEMKKIHPLKAEHPDWVIRTWWWQGLWNLAVPEVQDYKLKILRELAENYPLDGIQIDFARHVPCLPPGRQWEKRAGVTQFLRKVRLMLLDVEKSRGRPFLLAAKVPETLSGCRMDGFDVETWAQQNLVDVLSLGSRSIDVDLEDFRRIVLSRDIKLQPCLDDHHATDGYRFPPIEFFRGVFSNWWLQGADAVETFNWAAATAEVAARLGASPGPPSQHQAYHEVGNPESMRYKDKLFVVQRRGGYPWAEGYFNRNDFSPLPAILPNDGRLLKFAVRVSDDIKRSSPSLESVCLRLILFGSSEGDRLEVRLNGTELAQPAHNFNWKDPQIFSPKPQPASGGKGDYRIDPEQKLLLLVYKPAAHEFQVGANHVEIGVRHRTPYKPGADIQIEKIEVAVKYRKTEEISPGRVN